MNTFLPRNYTKPVPNSNYVRLNEGDNKFRILTSAIVGWEYWTQDNKPMRSKERFNIIPTDARIDDDGKFKPKHFWACVVWCYTSNSIKIWEITQKSIQDDLLGYVKSEDWGDIKNYDVVVKRTGERLETRYQTVANPHSPVPQEATEASERTHVNLEALFDGSDPFSADDVTITPEPEAPESNYPEANEANSSNQF